MIKAGGSRSKNIRSSRVSVRGTNRPEQVATTWGIHDEIFCPTETTFTFLTDVLGEVMEMFPGPLIHIGGDEVPKVRWKRSPAAQRLMKKEPLANEAALESYFLLRIGSRRKARVALRRRGHDRVDTSASRRPVGSSRG
jgi:N-acetyl-beta-hexosaminidase